MGLWVHKLMMKKDFRGNVRVSNFLVEVYARYGCIKLALQVFDRITQWNLVSWNLITVGSSQNEIAYEALSFFHSMKKEGFKPNGFTFTCSLRTCNHVGLIENGHEYVVSLIPTTDFLFGNWPMNIPLIPHNEIHTYSIIILTPHSLIKIMSENLYSQVGIVVIHSGCPKKSHVDFLSECLILTRIYFVNMYSETCYYWLHLLISGAWPLSCEDMKILVLPRQSLLCLVDKGILGVIDSTLYIKMLYNIFSLHVKDHYLYNTNYYHSGGNKTWYGAPRYVACEFEKNVLNHVYCNKVLTIQGENGVFQFISHKTTIFLLMCCYKMIF